MRKRRSRGAWFPIIGQDYIGEDTVTFTTARNATIDTAQGVIPVLCTSIVYDVPHEPDAADAVETYLSAYQANEYALQRVVGKLCIAVEDRGGLTWAAGPGDFPESYTVAAGLFVARAGDANDASGPGYPIGGTAALQTDYNPLDPDCIREPWLWRRTWVLGSPTWKLWQEHEAYNGATTGLSNTRGIHPSTNTCFGSALDGPHVDARTRRRVGNDDRLWLAVAAHANPFQATLPTNYAEIVCNWEFRVFGSLRKARNRGNF